MEIFAQFLAKIDDPEQRARTEKVLGWVRKKFPTLEPVIKWNQPMFTDHGTYIIGFSVAKKHLAVAPESVTISHFLNDIEQAGLDHTKVLIRFTWDTWDESVIFSLLEKMIEFNIWDKADCTTFWRK